MSANNTLKAMMEKQRNRDTEFKVEPISKIHMDNPEGINNKEQREFIIKPSMKFTELFERYPFLTDEIYSIHPNLKKLKSPLMLPYIPFSDIAKICEKTGVPFSELCEGIKKLAEKKGWD